VIVSSATDPQGIAFDAMGNLWVTDSTAGTIARYDAERLTASTAEPADLAITPRATATPGAAQRVPTYLAFDATGDLWAIDFAGNAVYELTPSQLAGAGAGDAVPAVQIAIDVLADLESMAFDEGGGLWLTFAQGQVARLAAAQLHQSTDAGSPTVPQTVIRSPDLGSAAGLAFYPSPAALPLYSSVR
jgi:streptogramin lyase